MFDEYFDETRGLAVIGICMTFAATNRREIVKRLMATSKAFKGYTFANAIDLFRLCERRGWVEYSNGFCKVFFDYGI